MNTDIQRSCKQKQREDKTKWAEDDHEESECRDEQRNKPCGHVKLSCEISGRNMCGEKPKDLLLGDNGGHSSQRTGLNSGQLAGTVF